MVRAMIPLSLLAFLCVLGTSPAADPAHGGLLVAQGTFDKAEKETVTIRPRGADGKFQKSLVLKVTGTTRLTTLAPQTREGKQVLTQKETQVKDLQQNQAIAVIYAGGDEPVLLAAVVETAAEK
jgi:hypothetical protein